MKIVSFEIENVKRVALVRLAPSENGLTVIGGDNCQGKTSVLDAIVYALGGEKYRPENLQREGSVSPARIRIEMTGGLVVERRGKNASLRVTDPSGKKGGQKLLDAFVEELALNLPKFLAMKDDEKADVLLDTLGIGEKLAALDAKEQAAYNRRHDYGVLVDQKKKFAAELPSHPDVPEEQVSPADIVAASEAIIRRNEERARARKELSDLDAEYHANLSRIAEKGDMVARLNREIEEIQARQKTIAMRQESARINPVTPDESTEELKAQIAAIDDTNAKVRANLDKAKAIAEAEEYERNLAGLTAELEAVRAERRALLDGAAMPLDGLTVGKNSKGHPVLVYNGQPWSSMSGMERIKVGAAIVRKLNPDCGFILVDGLEAFDGKQLAGFDEWLQANNLQAIATRVGSDGSTIVIEDGVAVDDSVEPAPEIPDASAPIPMDIPPATTEASPKEMDF